MNRARKAFRFASIRKMKTSGVWLNAKHPAIPMAASTMFTAGPAMLMIPFSLLSGYPAMTTAPGAANRNPMKEETRVMTSPRGYILNSDLIPKFCAVNL